ncbi:MAG: metallophosphoesterase [Lachnospiraceae bacterium]|nr:metallophosphoesterase [Lachnospiraceae bacterium]
MAKKKILIISDSHGMDNNMKKAIDQFGEMDMLIHLGDICGGEDYLRAIAPCGEDNVYIVRGNCDYNSDSPGDMIIDICGYKVLLTHGHHHYVRAGEGGLDHFRAFAEDNDIDIAMFGHIHIPVIDTSGKATLINPGSISQPRQSDRKKTFMRMEIDDDNKPHYSLGSLTRGTANFFKI